MSANKNNLHHTLEHGYVINVNYEESRAKCATLDNTIINMRVIRFETINIYELLSTFEIFVNQLGFFLLIPINSILVKSLFLSTQ